VYGRRRAGYRTAVPPSALDAFAGEATRLAAVLTGLTDTDDDAKTGLDLPSTCPPWTVRELACHVRIAVARLPGMLAAPAPPGPPVPAHAYYAPGRADPAANTDRIAAARLDAAAWPSPRAVTTAFTGAVDTTIAAARRHDPARLVRTRWGDPMTLEDYLVTRVVEVTVHGLDIAASLNRAPWTTPAAATVVTGLLTETGAGGAALPAALGWDPPTFIAKATGRQPLTDREQATVAGTGVTWLRLG